MSSYRHGIRLALQSMTGITLIIAGGIALGESHFRLSDEALSDVAQIGATLLVAYAIEMSWVAKESKTRGSKRENWIGFVTGIGLCGAIGIAIAVALVGNTGPSSFWQALGAVWAIASVGFLGVIVATLPYLLYELAHNVYIDYDD